MPNIKFTELSSTTELLATEDRLPFVDISDDAMGASGTNKTIDSTRLSESVATLMPDNKLSGLKLVNATLTANKLSLGAPSWTSAGNVSIGDGIASADLVVTLGKDRVSNGSTSLQLFSNNALVPTSTIVKDAGENSNLNISNVGSGNIIMTQNGTGSIVLSTANGERMRIASDGNIGIGKSNPGTPLDVQGTITATSLITPNITLDSSGIVFEGSTADNFETTLTVVNPTADRTITLPNVTGTVVTTGDTGTVSSTMIADGTIVNADISASAAIAGTKISASFGNQNILTTQTASSYNVINLNNTSGVQVHLNANGNTEGNLRTVTNHPLTLSTNNTERMRIAANGHVGIGTNNPSAPLDVKTAIHSSALNLTPDNGYNGLIRTTNTATSGQHINLTRAGNSVWSIGYVYNSNTFAIGQAQATDSSFTSPDFAITTAGNIGIGKTNPATKLDVNGTVTATTFVGNLTGTASAIANGAVTQASTSNMLVPSGAIMAFAMNSAPAGWLVANGGAVNRTTYASLFAAIGTTYGGGDGATTFNLPNLQGIFVRGSGSQTVGGVSYSRTHATTQNDALQNITGTVGQFDAAFANTVATGAFTTTQVNDTTGGGGTGKYLTANFDASRVARTDVETRPVNVAMLYCIKI